MNIKEQIKILIVKMILLYRKAIINILKAILFKTVDNPKKILIHRVGTFGDSIVTLPTIYNLKLHYKNSTFDFMTTFKTEINLSTIIEDSFFEKKFLFDKRERKKGLKKIKSLQYDLLIDLPQNYGLIKTIRNMLIVRFYLNIKSAYGWDKGMVKIFAKEQMKFYPPKREKDRFLNILKQENIPIIQEKYPIKLKKYHNIPNVVKTKKTIAFVIGTNIQANIWPTNNWILLGKKLQEDGWNIVIIGGKQEEVKSNEICNEINNCYNLCGKTDIEQSGYLLKKYCDIAVCHDTGAMHLSYAVGTKVIAIFSTRQLFSKWLPPENNTGLFKIIDCSGCFYRKCEDNMCVKNITINEVYSEISKLY